MRLASLAFVVLLAASLTGCHGGRINLIDQQTEQGIWYDSMLIRHYADLKLPDAVRAIDAYCKTKGLGIKNRDIGPYQADVVAQNTDGLRIMFSVWTPTGKPYTEVGVEIGDGDFLGSDNMLSELEKTLPGERVTEKK